MPPEGVPHLDHAEVLTYEEIVRVLGVAVEAGISKVRLTGGEPLCARTSSWYSSPSRLAGHESLWLSSPEASFLLHPVAGGDPRTPEESPPSGVKGGAG